MIFCFNLVYDLICLYVFFKININLIDWLFDFSNLIIYINFFCDWLLFESYDMFDLILKVRVNYNREREREKREEREGGEREREERREREFIYFYIYLILVFEERRNVEFF